MTPLIRQDGPAAREDAGDCRPDTDPAVRPGTARAGAGNEAAVTVTSVPPLSGGPGSHGAQAAHALTIADSAGGALYRNSLAGGRAVTCGLTMTWSSGPVEGRVNHIKMVKRQMFGRPGLPLLRKRVLLTAKK